MEAVGKNYFVICRLLNKLFAQLVKGLLQFRFAQQDSPYFSDVPRQAAQVVWSESVRRSC
jgi:hypothetical protein